MANNVEGIDGDDDNEEDPIGFPIQDTDGSLHMKNIPPSFLQKFHGLRSEDQETFPLEFEIVCRSYGYLLKAQKPRLFPAILKDRALKWFMSLDDNSIRSWNDMQNTFIEKYKYHDLK